MKTPKIGFDAKRANANRTGLGNYSRFVIDALAQHHPELDIRLCVPKRKANEAYDALLDYLQVSEALPQSKLWRTASSLWRTFGIASDLRRGEIDLFHGLSNELPTGLAKRNIRSVVTIHDLIFLRYPQFYKPIDRAIYTWKFRYACRAADRVVAVSECTKRDIVRFFGIDPQKVEVIYQGCSPEFAEPVPQAEMLRVKERYNLPDRFIFNVGSIESRKNLLQAVKALPYLPEDVHLVAVGRHTKYADEVLCYAAAHGLSERVHLHYKVPFADLLALYPLSEAFVYPSYFEGFGIPIIEAISAGLPVVAAKGSCLEEAGGEACIYISPDDEQALAEAVKRVLTDDELRKKMIRESRQYIRRFDKKVIADQFADLYARILDKKVSR